MQPHTSAMRTDLRPAMGAQDGPDALPYPFLRALARESRGGTTQRVQDVIREAIVSLAFRPGDFIQKDAICTRLGVSRFPVSEALGRLADEGFVEVLPQRGTRVTLINLATCRQAIFLRRAPAGAGMRARRCGWSRAASMTCSSRASKRICAHRRSRCSRPTACAFSSTTTHS